MRTLRLFAFYLLMGMLSIGFYSCSSDDEPEVEPIAKSFFEIEKVKYKISSESQIIDVLIHTNINVSLGGIDYSKENKGWITLINFEKNGNDYCSFQFVIKENTGENERTGYIYFRRTENMSDLPSNTVIITQAGAEP